MNSALRPSVKSRADQDHTCGDRRGTAKARAGWTRPGRPNPVGQGKASLGAPASKRPERVGVHHRPPYNQPQREPQTFCFPLTCRNYQQNPRSDSFNDRRRKSSDNLQHGARWIHSALLQRCPWNVLSLCLDRQQCLARPPTSVPSIFKGPFKFFTLGMSFCVSQRFSGHR